jgi:hypothetical protein
MRKPRQTLFRAPYEWAFAKLGFSAEALGAFRELARQSRLADM